MNGEGILEAPANSYGGFIRKEREAAGMSLEELAGSILLPPKMLREVEYGKETLSDFRLSMICNMFHLSRVELEKGNRVERIGKEELLKILKGIESQIKELQEVQKEIRQQILQEKVPESPKEKEEEIEMSMRM